MVRVGVAAEPERSGWKVQPRGEQNYPPVVLVLSKSLRSRWTSKKKVSAFRTLGTCRTVGLPRAIPPPRLLAAKRMLSPDVTTVLALMFFALVRNSCLGDAIAAQLMAREGERIRNPLWLDWVAQVDEGQ